MFSGMKRYALLTLGALALFAGSACERRDGKIIIDEQKAEQKIEHGAQKTGEAAKDLGHELKKGGQKLGEKIDEGVDELDRRHDENAPPKGVGGGPAPAAKDAGAPLEQKQY
jgi:hypothetical protein